MTIGYDFRQARRLTTRTAGGDREKLSALCRAIKRAEGDLLAAAAPLMTRCEGQCRGICCRNIDLDAIIGRGDLVFILALRPDLAPQMATRIQAQPRLFTADCVFLKDGVGPCIFPADVKPQVCLTTFCEDTAIAARQIRRVKQGFQKLDFYIYRDGWKRLARRLGRGLGLILPRR